ncbi:tetratricopeptide repeat protein [Streptomyces sp. DSM 42041]|uniref:Tetratricopeptide repeat protein n=1 Tax=Streptomyces hazeniae TaxID=3075538 RepID=A0ABU2NLE2_9ACTN|nr:tetratricopeptide repeat protein [Streptomyces sp. DSM 42041]MDT0377787.1 tetratricopeptide repeat protein [Streptomyces sp. DSM 42041]
MASSPSTSPGPRRGPNTAFRRLRGPLSPGEFAAAVRRSAREIGEQVACDARYVGRVEAGEIRCPNYAYERVFLHMFPGRTLADLGFAPRESVRGRAARVRGARGGETTPPSALTRRADAAGTVVDHDRPAHHPGAEHDAEYAITNENDEESDVLRRAFMTGGPAALVAVSLTGDGRNTGPGGATTTVRRAGETEAAAVEDAVHRIRLLDDRHGADGLYRRAGTALQSAYAYLDAGTTRRAVADRLHSGAGELAISVGWLAHDSGRFADARSHYAEALATARVSGDPALEAHAFCNTAFLARDAGRPREAVRAAQAGHQAAQHLGSSRLLSLLTLREAGGWAGLDDRSACEDALVRAHRLFARGPSDDDPPWMTFFGEAEMAGLESQCWSALGVWGPAVVHARRAVALQEPHFVRNRALFTAELAGDLAAAGRPDEAAAAASHVLELLGPVKSTRIRSMLAVTAARLAPHRREPAVSALLPRLPAPRAERA